jgi:hypothetical protein
MYNRAVYCLRTASDRQIACWGRPAAFAALCPKRFTTLSKTRRHSCWFMVAVSSPVSRVSACVVAGPFLCTPSFKLPQRKKLGTLRSGDRTGHAIPDTWDALRRSSTRYVLHTERALKWHDVFSFSACRFCQLPLQKCVLNVPVGSAPPCICMCFMLISMCMNLHTAGCIGIRFLCRRLSFLLPALSLRSSMLMVARIYKSGTWNAFRVF